MPAGLWVPGASVCLVPLSEGDPGSPTTGASTRAGPGQRGRLRDPHEQQMKRNLRSPSDQASARARATLHPPLPPSPPPHPRSCLSGTGRPCWIQLHGRREGAADRQTSAAASRGPTSCSSGGPGSCPSCTRPLTPCPPHALRKALPFLKRMAFSWLWGFYKLPLPLHVHVCKRAGSHEDLDQAPL